MDTSCIDATIAAVERPHAGRPPLQPVGWLALQVLRMQRDVLAGLHLDTPPIEPAVAAGRLAGGHPALGFDDLHVKPGTLHQTWHAAVSLFAEEGALTSAEAEELLNEGESGERLMRLAVPWYEHGAYESLQLRSSLTPELLDVTLKPWLLAAAQAVAPYLPAGDHGVPGCPACGGQPDLALVHRDGRRSLLCSRCDTEWIGRPSGCPICGRANGQEYHQGRTPGYLLMECRAGGHALPTVDAASFPEELMLPAERIFAIELDHLAAELNLPA